MKKRKHRKLWNQMLSIMMAIVLVMGCVPASALAAENIDADPAQVSETAVETEEQEEGSADENAVPKDEEENPEADPDDPASEEADGNEGSTQAEIEDQEDPEGQNESEEETADSAAQDDEEELPEEDDRTGDEAEAEEPAEEAPQSEGEPQEDLQEPEHKTIIEESTEEIAEKYAQLAGEGGIINIVDFTLYPGRNWLEILDESMCLAIFEPEIDDTYTFRSTGDKLKCATLYSNTWEELAFDIGDEEDVNFDFSIELTGGSTYVIVIEIDEGVPQEMQTIDVIGEKGLHTGNNYISVVSEDESVLKFVPEQDGIHTFSFRGSEGFGLRLYNDNMELLAEHSHFKISYDLVAGETYYLAARTLKNDIRERLSLSVSYGTEQISVSDAEITVSNQTYTGKALTPKPVVTVEGEKLTENTDYTLSYSNNVNAGTATVTVIGKENYTGEASATFTINKAAPTLSFAKTTLSKKTTDSAFTNTLTKKTDGTITYKSSNATIAAVNATSGKVTLKKAGTVKITATAAAGKNYKAGSASYTLTVILDYNLPKSLKLGVGQKYTLKPTFTKATYTSSSTGVAEVSSTGMITAKITGTTTIKAFSNKKQMASFKLTVVAAPSSVKLNPTAITLGVKESYTIAPVIASSSCTSFTYSSKNKAIATVDAKGVVKGVKAGKTSITVKTHNGKTATLTVTVKNAPSSVTLSPASVSVGVGETYTLKPTIPSGSHASYTYSSKNKAIATVTAKGVIKGIKVGTTTVTVTTHNGKTASVTVTVMKAPAVVALGASAISLGIGESLTLKPTIPADSHTTYTYATSSTAIVTVTSKGALKGIKAGKATITVTAHNGKKATLTVYVRKAPASVTLDKSTLQLNEGDTFQLKAILPDLTASKITWKSSNVNVVTVNSKGLLTAKGQGTAKITATTFNNKSASCTVTVYGDFVFSGQTLVKYNGNGTDITVPAAVADGSPVLAIGDSAFEGNTTIQHVTLPDTVTSIGDSAFKDCTALTAIDLPADLKTIGGMAFSGDTALTSLDLPYGTTSIDSQAFANSSLEEIYLPETVETIGSDAFDGLPDVIFYSPAGSYADEYAQEKDYQSENAGIHYREQQLQEQLAFLEELEAEEGEEGGSTETIDLSEYTTINLDEFAGIEIDDEEYLQLTDIVNEDILASKAAFEAYLTSANEFSTAYNEAVEKISDFTLEESENGIRLEIGDFSYGLYGNAIDGLGSDYEILSSSVTEDQELLVMEVESEGKIFFFVEDTNGITVYDEETYHAIYSSRRTRKISLQRAADVSESRLESFLNYLSDKSRDWTTYIDLVKEYIPILIEKNNDCIQKNEAAIENKEKLIEKIKSNREDSLLYAKKACEIKNPDNPDYSELEIIKKKYDVILNYHNEDIKTLKKDLNTAKEWNKALTTASRGLKKFSQFQCLMTIVEDTTRFYEVTAIKLHGHPTEMDASDPDTRAIADHLNENITCCYIAIGCEAATAALDMTEALSNVAVVVSICSGPLGISIVAIDKVAVKGAINILKKFAADFAQRAVIGFASEHYYKIVKKDDDKLHSFVGGTVKDETTGEPIPRVKVSCGRTRVYTNSQGKFVIKAGLGLQTVKFEKHGYRSIEKQIELNEYQSKLLNVTMLSTGMLEGHVYDATTGGPLSGVTVTYGYYTTTTDSEGHYQFNVPSGKKTLTFSKDKYITESYTVEVKEDSSTKKDAVLSKKLDSDQYRIVLTWGASPEDLDSHLVGPGYHVYFSEKNGSDANLDVDDTESFGPETVTFKIKANGYYKYYVHDYTNRENSMSRALSRSGAKVLVYNGNNLVAQYSVPGGIGIHWNVFEIVNGEYKAINTIN